MTLPLECHKHSEMSPYFLTLSQVKVIAEDRAEWEGKVFVSEPFSRLPPLATTPCITEDRGKLLFQYFDNKIIAFLTRVNGVRTEGEKTRTCFFFGHHIDSHDILR